jgi:thiol-disulfide isomerase/thioredoxin
MLFVAVALGVVPVSMAKWGRIGSEVDDLTKSKDIKMITSSKHLTVVALYRDGCGYCELLKPEWEKVSNKMRKLVRVAALDVVRVYFRFVSCQVSCHGSFSVVVARIFPCQSFSSSLRGCVSAW